MDFGRGHIGIQPAAAVVVIGVVVVGRGNAMVCMVGGVTTMIVIGGIITGIDRQGGRWMVIVFSVVGGGWIEIAMPYFGGAWRSHRGTFLWVR